jgi:cyclic di-GMP phosphodiesterase
MKNALITTGFSEDRRGRKEGSANPLAPNAAPPIRVLIVDDEAAVRKALAVVMTEEGMACKTAAGAKEALAILEEEPQDAVIADLHMPNASGMQLLAWVRHRYPKLAFLMATGTDDVRVGVEAMRQGADDYLIKPLQVDAVRASLERAFHKKYLEQEVENYHRHLERMVGERTVQVRNALEKLEQSYVDTLDALGAAIDLRDSQTAGHSRRVTLYSIKILTVLNGTPQQLKSTTMAALLHDIGKLATPDGILLKPGSLTQEERRIMECHVQIGYDLIKRIPFLADAAEIILAHHERLDGSGYPRGLRGLDIPLGARVFAVADTVDAMTSDRPYRSALPFEDARREVERRAGIQFDPQVANVFLAIPSETWQAIREKAASAQFGAALAGISIGSPDDSTESVRIRAD